MPELPEVESARAVIEHAALGRRIVEVDDSDTYVCRPHQPGEIRAALLGRRLTAAHRQGKSMWCDTSGTGRSAAAGPVLGIHLGMTGKIVVADGRGQEIDGGDYWERGRAVGDHRFTRFSLTFADGGSMLLIDPRRLGRIRLDPPVEALGPDAGQITQAQFRAALARGTAPVKARLLNQDALAGIGNLLADQVLWLAMINPGRQVDELTRSDVDQLFQAVQQSVRSSVADGGVHALPIISIRRAGAVCPRCGAPMAHGTVAGRTTWWCSREQGLAGRVVWVGIAPCQLVTRMRRCQMHATVGDRLHVHGNIVGQADHIGEIMEVRGAGGEPPYVVRFEDGHTGLIFPGPDAVIDPPSKKERNR